MKKLTLLSVSLITLLANFTYASHERCGVQLYSLNKNKVLFREAGRELVVEGADASSFEGVLRAPESKHLQELCKQYSNYGKDSKRVYFQTKPLNGADPKSFEAVGFSYGRDNARAYFRNVILESERAPRKLKLLNESVAIGSENAYCGSTPMKRESLQDLGHGFVRNLSQVCMRDKLVPVRDPASFRVHAGSPDYQLDSQAVYLKGVEIPGADSASIKLVNGELLIDAKSVFWAGKKVEGADADTFKVEYTYGTGSYARDAKRVYVFKSFEAQPSKSQKRIHVQPRSLVPLSGRDAYTYRQIQGGYSADKNGVYFENRVVKGADPATFRHVIECDRAFGRDLRGYYSADKFLGPSAKCSGPKIKRAYDIRM